MTSSESPASSKCTSDEDDCEKTTEIAWVLDLLDEDDSGDSGSSEKSRMTLNKTSKPADEDFSNLYLGASASCTSESAIPNNSPQMKSMIPETQDELREFNLGLYNLKVETKVEIQSPSSSFCSQFFPQWNPTTSSEGFDRTSEPLVNNAMERGFSSTENPLRKPVDILSNFPNQVWSWRFSEENESTIAPLPHWPRSFSTYVAFSCQYVGYVYFYIQYPDAQTMKANRNPLDTTVTDPVGREVYINTMADPNRALRVICSFQARGPGLHKVSVTTKLGLLNSCNISGSPFCIPVSRNYGLPTPLIALGSYLCPATKAWGIAHNPLNEKVYVADRETNQILTYNADGILVDSFGLCGTGPGRMHRPTGIAIDCCRQRIIVSDKDNHRICIFSMNGVFQLAFGQRGYKNGEFHYPWGVDVSANGELIVVADSRNHRVQMFDYLGNFIRKYSVFESNPFEYKSQFNYPRGVIFDKEGQHIYVTDFNIHTVFKLNIELTTRTSIVPDNTSLSRPQGLTLDAVGNLLVCDSRNNCIRIINPQGELVTSLAGGNSLFHMPQDVIVFPNGLIGVVDCNSCIKVF